MAKIGVGISLIFLGYVLTALWMTLLAIGVYGPVIIGIALFAIALNWLGFFRLWRQKRI